MDLLYMFNNMICVLKIYYISLEYIVNVLNLVVYIFCFVWFSVKDSVNFYLLVFN